MNTNSRQIVDGVTYYNRDLFAKKDIEELQGAAKYKNILDNHPISSQTIGGMTYTLNPDGTISISGTQASTTLVDFYVSASAFPSDVKKDAFYRFRMPGTENVSNKVDFCIYLYDGNDVGVVASELLHISDNESIVYIPEKINNVAYPGIIIRIRVRDDVSSYSAKVKPEFSLMDTKEFIPAYINNSIKCTGAVKKALTTYNEVRFDTGVFAFDEPIMLPDGAKVSGAGRGTRIGLGGDSSYTFNLAKENEISDILFYGGEDSIDISTPGYGSGLRYYRNQQSESTDGKIGFIHNCWFYNFGYAGIEAQNTGGGVNEGLVVSNCYFQHCWCGIAMIQRTEYWEVSECVIFDCTVGVINNGGNNKFINCSFKTNGVAFYVNSNDAYVYNDGHGQCIGCSFNHIGNNQGIAIRAHTLYNGYDFIGCHFWYSKVEIINSKGVRFLGCAFGQLTPQIAITGSDPAFIQSCLFYDEPTLNLNEATVVTDCYQFDGTPVVNE